jgi:hypothetical protein
MFLGRVMDADYASAYLLYSSAGCQPLVRIVSVPRDGQSCRRRRFSLLCRPWARGWQNTTKHGPSLREGPVTGASGEGGCGVWYLS